jgi:tetratricopeptide (TPR) repeat protein
MPITIVVFYTLLKNYQLAIEDFNRAIELKADNVGINTFKGYSEYMLGQKENACIDFKKGSELGDSKAEEYIVKYCK